MQHVRQTYKLRYAALQRTDIINQVYVHTIAGISIYHMLGDRRHLEHSTYSHYSIILPPLIANTWRATDGKTPFRPWHIELQHNPKPIGT